jgi:ribosomal protein S18 acetylase RimI-like enzyme
MTSFSIRPATPSDKSPLGVMAAQLVRLHHAFDPQRFFIMEPIEEGYGKWLARQSSNAKAVVLVAEREGRLVGYTYATLEDRDWNDLRDACGKLHDVWVEADARRSGVAHALVEATCAQLEKLGAPRVVLMTAAKNEGAQKLFAREGFRPTMIEMTREL